MKELLGRKVPETLEEIVNPEHTVVFVQDMQNDFLHKDGLYLRRGLAQDASRIFQPLASFLGEARRRTIRVMYCVYTNYPDYSNYSDPGIMRASPDIVNDASHGVVEGTWGWQIIDEVKPQDGERVIKKNRNDAFIGTNLELILRSSGVRTIIHVGIAIPNGILTTAWHAYNLGFYPVIPRDAAGAAVQALEPEGWKLLGRCSTITTTEEIVKAWGS